MSKKLISCITAITGIAVIDPLNGGNGNYLLRGNDGVDIFENLTPTGFGNSLNTSILRGNSNQFTISVDIGADSFTINDTSLDSDTLCWKFDIENQTYPDTTIQSTAGDDFIGGIPGDVLLNEVNDDSILDDFIIGTSGINTLYGGNGNDVLVGGTGKDFLQGNDGVDTLYGGNSNEFTITVNPGNIFASGIDTGTSTLVIDTSPGGEGYIVATFAPAFSDKHDLGIEEFKRTVVPLDIEHPGEPIRFTNGETSEILPFRVSSAKHGTVQPIDAEHNRLAITPLRTALANIKHSVKLTPTI